MGAMCRAILGFLSELNLVGEIGLPSRSGDNALFGERIPVSFLYCTITVRAENRRKPAPHGVSHWDGEWLDKGRLEQR